MTTTGNPTESDCCTPRAKKSGEATTNQQNQQNSLMSVLHFPCQVALVLMVAGCLQEGTAFVSGKHKLYQLLSHWPNLCHLAMLRSIWGRHASLKVVGPF